ncbi:uncharacterized protein LOC127741565 [Arachis duranensis]|uniref:Uncharacterized protein LOC127741565 n=1 Tax=Arachis duranensis TaxID=130453 RepID=A0A9C6WCM0_ARADU|nr:uncharacterized protein LOC127741565 [Arachis duranensis]
MEEPSALNMNQLQAALEGISGQYSQIQRSQEEQAQQQRDLWQLMDQQKGLQAQWMDQQREFLTHMMEQQQEQYDKMYEAINNSAAEHERSLEKVKQDSWLGYPSTILRLCEEAGVPLEEFEDTDLVSIGKPITKERLEYVTTVQLERQPLARRKKRKEARQEEEQEDMEEPSALNMNQLQAALEGISGQYSQIQRSQEEQAQQQRDLWQLMDQQKGLQAQWMDQQREFLTHMMEQQQEQYDKMYEAINNSAAEHERSLEKVIQEQAQLRKEQAQQSWLGYPSTILRLCEEAGVPLEEFEDTDLVSIGKPITKERLEYVTTVQLERQPLARRKKRKEARQEEEQEDMEEPNALNMNQLQAALEGISGKYSQIQRSQEEQAQQQRDLWQLMDQQKGLQAQ